MYLTVACTAKNEDLYIEEWINYHRAIGAEHIFIYDNESTNPLKKILDKYIKQGLVTVTEFPGKKKQIEIYTHALNNFGNKSKWMAFIDVDEFLVPKQHDSLPELLSKYEQYGGLGSNWRYFGNNGHIHRPDGLVIENYTKAARINWCMHRHVKSIVQPAKVEKVKDSHCFAYKSPHYAVIENNQKIIGSISCNCEGCSNRTTEADHSCGDVYVDKIQTNHYFTKSYDEFMIRMKNGKPLSPGETRSSPNGYKIITEASYVDETSILRFVDKTKALYL